jgi:hypothetical protein
MLRLRYRRDAIRLSHGLRPDLVNCITDGASRVVSRSDGFDVLNFLPRNERVAQQHGFRPSAEVAALFHSTELRYVT